MRRTIPIETFLITFRSTFRNKHDVLVPGEDALEPFLQHGRGDGIPEHLAECGDTGCIGEDGGSD